MTVTSLSPSAHRVVEHEGGGGQPHHEHVVAGVVRRPQLRRGQTLCGAVLSCHCRGYPDPRC